MCLLWWLGVASSPCKGLGLEAGVFYPLATAFAGLATAHLLGRFTALEGWHELGWLGDLRSSRWPASSRFRPLSSPRWLFCSRGV